MPELCVCLHDNCNPEPGTHGRLWCTSLEVLLTRSFAVRQRADFSLVICLFINDLYHPAFSFPFPVWNPALQFFFFLSSFCSDLSISGDPCVSSSPVVLQLADDLGNEKFCVDASQSGAGNWLKYIRVACSCDEQNLAVCHVNDQVMTSVAVLTSPLQEMLGWVGQRMLH